MRHVRSQFPEPEGVNGSTRQRLQSASNYLAASAFLLRDPGSDASELRLIERAGALIEEAASIMNDIKRAYAREEATTTHASLRALVEKASGWLITPSGARVALDIEIGDNATFIRCDTARFVQALEALFAKACAALDQVKDRRIEVATRRTGEAIEIEMRYAAPALRNALSRANTARAQGELPPGPALPDYRRIIGDHGGTLLADYGAAGWIALRLTIPAAA